MTSIAVSQRAGAAVSAGERTNSRVWAWMGLTAFIVGVFVTWSVQFVYSMDDLNAGGQQLYDALDTTENQVLFRVTSGLGYLVVGALIAFGVGFKRFLERRSEGKSDIPNVIFGSILVTAAALGLAMSFRAQVFDGFTAYQDSTASHITINRLQQDGVLAAWATMLAATVATAVGGLRGTLFPKGIAWFSAVMSAFIVVFCMVGGAFPANIPALLWLGVVSAWAIRASGRAS